MNYWQDYEEYRQMEDEYWYNNRHLLKEGMVFEVYDGIVKLDRRVPGDGTKWYVVDFFGGSWCHYDATYEPGDFKKRRKDLE